MVNQRKVEDYLSKQAQKHIAEYRKNQQFVVRDWGGVNRLKRLCSPEMRDKFNKAERMIENAINGGMADSIKGMVAMMERAFYALVTEVTERGFKPIEPVVKYYEFESRAYMICDHDHQLELVHELYDKEPNTVLISMEQLVKFLPAQMSDILQQIQEFAPTAHFTKVEKKKPNTI